MTHEEWLTRRKEGIGGSDVAAILGISPWKTPLDVYLDKIGEAPETPVTESMLLGTALEQFVADRFTEQTGRQTSRFNTLLKRGHSIGNVDRLIVPEGQRLGSNGTKIATDELLECKTSSVEWTDGVPAYYLSQVQHYMGLDDMFKRATVACMFIGLTKSFKLYTVERDNELIGNLQDAVERFWADHVEKRIPPAPQSEEDCRKLWSRNEAGATLEADDAIKDAVSNLRDVTAKIKALEGEESALKKQIMEAMGTNEILTIDGKKAVTWKCNKDSVKTNWQMLAESYNPDEAKIAEFTTTTAGARVFRLGK